MRRSRIFPMWMCAALLPLLPPTASTQPDLRSLLLFHARRFGLSEAQEIRPGRASEGEPVHVSVRFESGRTYAVLGVCSQACKDLDVYLYSGGTLVDEDIEPDAYPLIRHIAQTTGLYMVEVRMEECATSRCDFLLGVFRTGRW